MGISRYLKKYHYEKQIPKKKVSDHVSANSYLFFARTIC